jgi:non-heme chloroperoxidase
MLPAETDLDVISALPDGPRRGSVLFVHGAYTDNWCWQPYYLPYFARRGYAAHALSLRGHGRSGGRATLFATSLDDYATDVATVVERLGERPVLVGHSMGAAVVERAIEQIRPPAAALLAPVPPGGLFALAHELFATQPGLLLDFQELESGRPSASALEALRPFYFTDDVDPHLLWETVVRTQSESARALIDLTFRWESPLRNHRPPTLVVAAEHDQLFPPRRVRETAARHGTDAVVAVGLPHMLMLDNRWESGARLLADWIETALGA